MDAIKDKARQAPSWRSPRRLIQGACLALFLLLLFLVSWPYGSPDYAATLRNKEWLPAEFFLLLDPLVGLTTAVAAKAWVPALLWTGVLFLLSLFYPRGFCGYLCPLGTTIDLFDWAVASRIKQFRVKDRGWWVHLKYYLLAGILVAAVAGVLISGFLAAIPVVTRGYQFVLGPLQLGGLKGWYLVPAIGVGVWISVALFLVVLGLGLLRPRFWCSYVCPTGATFSIGNFLRLRERRITADCISCQRCLKACSFDAIKSDFTTRNHDCTVCETCAEVCPTDAIQFVTRWQPADQFILTSPPNERPVSRRGFLAGAAGGLAGATGIYKLAGAKVDGPGGILPVRPPGSVAERDFLQLCIRCGLCFQACPNNVLQPLGFQQGLEGIWTPQVVASWSGCEPKCNNCGQVCPTGAIRPLPLEIKRQTHMALAILNEQTCLPLAGREACQLCVDECKAAGYNAIEFERVGTRVDGDGNPVEGSGFLAPVVLAEKCVGCGLCETRCHKINVLHKRLLKESAIRIFAGPGREDRPHAGEITAPPAPKALPPKPATNSYLPDFLK